MRIVLQLPCNLVVRALYARTDYLHALRPQVRDLDFPIQIIGLPICREPDGLAMSRYGHKALLGPLGHGAPRPPSRLLEHKAPGHYA